MFRAQKVVSPVLDLQMRRAADQKHLKAISTQKPQVDMSTPPTNPRLIRYHKRIAKERKLQTLSENERIKMINEIHEKQQTKRNKTATSLERKTLLDWSKRIPSATESAKPEFHPQNLESCPPILPLNRKRKQVLTDDGMMVFDSTATSPMRSPRSGNISRDDQGLPIKKPNSRFSKLSHSLFNDEDF